LYPFRSVRWDTLVPKRETPKTFIKKWAFNYQEDYDNPLTPKKKTTNLFWTPVKPKGTTPPRKWISLREHLGV
jgi:hypothetical protein